MKLIEGFRHYRSFIFTQQNGFKREKLDHSKILQKIKKHSKKMSLKMPMYIVPEVSNDDKIIKGKYEIQQELKESTFSNLFIVV